MNINTFHFFVKRDHSFFSAKAVSSCNAYHCTARTLLEGSPLQVAASFPLNYWNIVMAILVLFSAEVFSIGSRLSEEQKLTI